MNVKNAMKKNENASKSKNGKKWEWEGQDNKE